MSLIQMRTVLDRNDKKINTNESSLTGFCSKYRLEQDKRKED